MGSSKKHKEKDKDRERRHKHKDRDKDRDKERKHRSKHRHRDRHAEKDVEAGEVSSPEQRSDRKRRRSPSPLQIKIENDDGIQDNERQDAAPSGGDEGGFAASLSIEATNKLRAKLGLAPLNVDGEGSGEPGEIVEEKKDVHKPAVNISDLKKTAALKEKMAQIREKRLINKKLHKVKVLADDDDDDDAAAWVERMRKKQIAKAEADKMAKMLEEMDAEFGIGKIVEDEFRRQKSKWRFGLGGRHREEEEDDSETPVVRKVERRVPQQDAMDMEVDFPDADQIPIEFGRERDDNDDIWGQVIEDEAEKELHNVLNKARKLKQKSKSSQRVEDQVAKVVASIKEEPEDDEEAAASASNKGSNIVFNSTSEFCRTLGDIPSYGKSGLRDEEEETLADNEKEDEEEEAMEDEDEEEAAGAWNTVNMDDREEIKQEEEELGPVLDDEPPLQVGIAGALTLATKKGYLIKEKKKKTGDSLILTSKNCTIEEKNFNDIDSKYNKNDRFRGPLMDFKEKSGYKPEVKITYTDETGRSLNQKEAFRVLSHRFHGKGSGKMKTEKRAKKVLEEEAMKKMSSTDTPLHTVARMQEKQKNLQSAHIVLSGGSKTMTAHSITK
eukprot:XP_011677139.1 PREDICTED: U4/U6.U5 tri-snRNP-associated protein 1 [Strongylocentrotus purpuratus]